MVISVFLLYTVHKDTKKGFDDSLFIPIKQSHGVKPSPKTYTNTRGFLNFIPINTWLKQQLQRGFLYFILIQNCAIQGFLSSFPCYNSSVLVHTGNQSGGEFVTSEVSPGVFLPFLFN